MNSFTKALILSVIGTLAGCEAIDTKTIASNSDAYLANSFTPAQLAQSVRPLIEKGEQLPKQFSRIEYRTIADLDVQGKISQITSSGSFMNLGGGYIQNRVEHSRNGVPYRINLALTFAGIYELKTQTAFVNRPNADYPHEVKEISQFDRGLGSPLAGQTYRVAAKTGKEAQFIEFSDEVLVCTAGQSVQATSVNPALSGTAVPIDCTMTGRNGLIVAKNRFMWIADLGVAFLAEDSNASSTSRYKLESVNIQQ